MHMHRTKITHQLLKVETARISGHNHWRRDTHTTLHPPVLCYLFEQLQNLDQNNQRDPRRYDGPD